MPTTGIQSLGQLQIRSGPICRSQRLQARGRYHERGVPYH
jgi:hypothetical protein